MAGTDAVAARLRMRERARAQQQALTAAYAAEQGVRRAEQRRAELTARGDRIVAAARAQYAAALRGLTTACGSDRVAAELVDIPVRRLRALTVNCSDGPSPSNS